MQFKYIITFLLLLTLFTSCKKKVIPTTDLVKKPLELQRIFGGGFEPMWSIVLNKVEGNKFQLSYTNPSIKDAVEEEIIMSTNFSIEKNDETVFKGKNAKGETIKVTYRITPCLNMAGEDSGGVLTYKIGKITLEGCGTYSLKK